MRVMKTIQMTLDDELVNAVDIMVKNCIPLAPRLPERPCGRPWKISTRSKWKKSIKPDISASLPVHPSSEYGNQSNSGLSDETW
jgi:hypothetical protein